MKLDGRHKSDEGPPTDRRPSESLNGDPLVGRANIIQCLAGQLDAPCLTSDPPNPRAPLAAACWTFE